MASGLGSMNLTESSTFSKGFFKVFPFALRGHPDHGELLQRGGHDYDDPAFNHLPFIGWPLHNPGTGLFLRPPLILSGLAKVYPVELSCKVAASCSLVISSVFRPASDEDARAAHRVGTGCCHLNDANGF